MQKKNLEWLRNLDRAQRLLEEHPTTPLWKLVKRLRKESGVSKTEAEELMRYACEEKNRLWG